MTHDSNITALYDAQIASERRKEFLNDVANSYDLYTKDFGEEPEAIVFVLGGITQSARVAFTTEGLTQRGSSSMLALAHVTLLKRIVEGPR